MIPIADNHQRSLTAVHIFSVGSRHVAGLSVARRDNGSGATDKKTFAQSTRDLTYTQLHPITSERQVLVLVTLEHEPQVVAQTFFIVHSDQIPFVGHFGQVAAKQVDRKDNSKSFANIINCECYHLTEFFYTPYLVS